MDGDSLLRPRMPTRPGPNIRAILEDAAAPKEADVVEPEAFTEGELLPKLGDPYKAHSRLSARPEKTLHIMQADGRYDGFPWSSYDRLQLLPPEKPGSGPVLVITFAGSKVVDVRIEGRNLSTLHAYLGLNRVSFIRELAKEKDYRGEGETVITRISIHALEE